MSKKNSKKRKIKVYTSEILNSQLLVCVGVSIKVIKKWADKNSKNLKEIFKSKENISILSEAIKNQGGAVMCYTVDELKYFILYLTKFDGSWKDLDILNHEIVHYRQFQFKDRKIEDETEFEAYFQESTFRDLRKLLNK